MIKRRMTQMTNYQKNPDSIKIACYGIIAWASYSFIITMIFGTTEQISAQAVSFSVIEAVIFVGSSIATLNKRYLFLWVIIIALIIDTLLIFSSPFFSPLALILRLGLLFLVIIAIKKSNEVIPVNEEFKEPSSYEGKSKINDKEERKNIAEEFVFNNTEEFYSNILKLSKYPTVEEIKKNYRDEIQKYHPDKVEHLGDEFKRIAEKKTKELNEAYNYFRKKYSF
ncbi:MAG: J domain-containing protein [Ignavibacteriaceae bacterium]|nr:J domain-containing protein [Ignavibacteriaceae bacterium]